ncbi:MAG: hypothetical protein KJ737_09175 [Proteobacteria bacterium]|nr:hypothetical protein [Pseudomonadota bacterium]
MQNNRLKSSDVIQTKPSGGSEIDYSPKTYTLREQVVFLVKLLGIFGIIFSLLWVI